MAHKVTASTRRKVREMLADRKPNYQIAKFLRISVNTFMSRYEEVLFEYKDGIPEEAIKKLVKVSKAHGATDNTISDAVGVSVNTLKGRFRVELAEGYDLMGPTALKTLLGRVVNGVKETQIAYEITEWDEDGKPKAQKIVGYGEKTKDCSTRDVQMLINLTTNGISFKDEEMIRVHKEINGIKDGLPDVKDKTLDYSKLSTEDLIDLKVLLGKARIDG